MFSFKKIIPRYIVSVILLSIFVMATGCVSKSMRVYGTPAVLSAKGERVSQALAEKKKWDGGAVVVRGTIVEVDQEAGAWLVLADSKTPDKTNPESTVRVVKESPRLLFPANAAGHKARVLGNAKIFTTPTGGTSLELTAIGIGIENPENLATTPPKND